MTSSRSLEHYYNEHTGYVSDKWELYLSEYERLFESSKERPINILEIGIQNGGSLAVWGKFFPNAKTIVGCDINPKCSQLSYDDPRIHVVIGDINEAETIERLSALCSEFDIIIDDGSHTSDDIINSFNNLFSRLRHNGIYVAEDLHCSYWLKYGGGLYHSQTSMAFFKALADVLNFEHWGLPSSRQHYMRRFAKNAQLSEQALSEVHSIEFVNSMCIVRRKDTAQNVLGRRRVVGEQETVNSIKRSNNTHSHATSQVGANVLHSSVLSSKLRDISDYISARADKMDLQSTEPKQMFSSDELENIIEEILHRLYGWNREPDLLRDSSQIGSNSAERTDRKS